MRDSDFFCFAADHAWFLFLASIFLSLAFYFASKKIALAGYLDPWHYYYAFTFGSAYSIVITLFCFDIIDLRIFSVVAVYGVVFYVLLRFFIILRHGLFVKCINILVRPQGKLEHTDFYLVLCVYFLIVALIIKSVGFGFLAESNRFEQAKGYGAFIRVADALRLFITAYLTIILVKNLRHNSKVTVKSMMIFLFLIFFILLSSLLNGAKFAFLESIYAAFTGLAAYGMAVRFSLVKSGLVFLAALFFCFFVLLNNLKKNDVDIDGGGQYFTEVPALAERFILRVLGNGDKYYLLLPDGVIDKIDKDNLLIRFLSPIVGITKLSAILNYNVGDYTVGRQAILYWDPGNDVAGGPTSHFDLFAYKYLGFFLGISFIVFITWAISCIRYLLICAQFNEYMAAIAAALWVRSMALLLEPPVGMAYIFDIIVLFCMFKLVGILIGFVSSRIKS